jgi:uncharacterized delta-60 repeat protein
MKKQTTKIVSGMCAALLGSALVMACGEDPPPDDAGGARGDGSDSDSLDSDGAAGGQNGSGGSGSGGGQNIGGGGGGGEPVDPVDPTLASIVPKSAKIVDNMLNAYGTVFASDGKIYVAGVTDVGLVGEAQAATNLRLAVWRFNPDGNLDATFGTDGKLTSGIANPGTAYDIIEWQAGKFAILISGGAAFVAVVPFEAGAFGPAKTIAFGWDDPSQFATALATKVSAIDIPCASAKIECDQASVTLVGGVCNPATDGYPADCNAAQTECAAATTTCQAEYPLAVGPNFNQRPGNYASWGMALDNSGSDAKLVVFAAGPPAQGSNRWDADRWITRLRAHDLGFDDSFHGGAPYGHDVSGLGLSDGARRGAVGADGTIVSSGYTSIPGKGNHIALLRLLPTGAIDEDFGFSDDEAVPFTPGQTHYNPFRGVAGFAEAYGVAFLNDGSLVTTGYGTTNMFVPSVNVDLVVTRIKADGTGPTPSFGGREVGSAIQYPGALAVQSEADNSVVLGSAEDRGRDVAALPDNRTIHAGLYDGQSSLVFVTDHGNPDLGVFGSGRVVYKWATSFFSVNLDAAGTRIVASSQAVAKVVGTSYAKTLLATLDVMPAVE